MCCQKVNRNWRKSKPLPSLGQSRFSQLRTVTWTPRPPANSSPHSTSLPPPPTGTAAGKCISRNLNCHPWARTHSHIMSFLIHKLESFWHNSFLQFVITQEFGGYSLDTRTIDWGLFYQGHLYQIDSWDPRSCCCGMEIFQWQVEFKMETFYLVRGVFFFNTWISLAFPLWNY